ncbi:MAG TPA: alpha/beta fold hydrolase [Phycisphaerales bacterium]|nr:alpha/beta fold hydrolase [Phycisphaerales bacterium]HRQ75166.1 alpha/beta fold hydrolase [Phycisphaerales bacterium]
MAIRWEPWSILGADGQIVYGDAHMPEGKPRGVILLAHGFKGYKDYGMFPRLARDCAMAGFLAHRFNFSHSGMTNQLESFARPDLFERDTWSKQVFDLLAVIRAMDDRAIMGNELPFVLFGHSRGGVAAMLLAGRHADDAMLSNMKGVMTAAAPARACSMSDEEQKQLLRDGYIESPSARTGQRLRVGKAFLQEQLDAPAAHDVLSLVRRIRCPMLIVHGDHDATVPMSDAWAIGDAAQSSKVVIVPGGDHVFNVSNPLAEDAPSSPQLTQLSENLIAFAADCVR